MSKRYAYFYLLYPRMYVDSPCFYTTREAKDLINKERSELIGLRHVILSDAVNTKLYSSDLEIAAKFFKSMYLLNIVEGMRE